MEGEGVTEEVARGDGDGRGLGGAATGQRQRDASSAGRQVIRWERFLPRRSLKVLLVEYDDSTRHIVAALLRKCSYHVAAVADGMKAWEVLKERHYSFDLVLTEVAMPSLSGIGLLTKIMASEECKNIPVIMMSSHDSVGVVYKCMLKGAVDFLVKPVRKNELRNLWQHVWRKHCSSSYADASDNNAASNHISADADDRSKAGENSGERSTTQSSSSKPDAEIESVWKPMEPNLAEQASFSGQVEEKLQHPVNGMTMAANALKMDKSGRRKGKSVEIGVEVILPILEASIAEKGQKQNKSHRTSPYRNGVADPLVLRSKEDRIVGPGLHRGDNGPDEPLQSVGSFVKSVDNGQCGNAVLEENAPSNEALCAVTMVPNTNNANNFSSVPLLEPSLRRPQQNGYVIQEFKERHILIHSNASAFSRYGEKRIHPSSQKSVSSLLCIGTRECDDKCHSNAHSHGIDDEKNTCLPSRDMFSSPKRNEEEAMAYFQVSSDGNKEEAGILSSGLRQEDDTGNHSSTGEVTGFHQAPLGFMSLPIPVGAVPYQSFCVGYSAILHPMFHPDTSLAQHCSDTADVPNNQIPCDHSVQQDNHLVSNNPYFKFQPHDDSHQSYHTRQPNDIEASGPNAFSYSPVEPVNQSGSCSQDILNGIGSNGSGETTDATGNPGTALESGNESGVQNCNSKAMDSDRARREAALIKFRLKRKDRCFEKRVRYHSRKKLAEQRPRVKGQFVRQKVPDSVTATEADD